jgi:hypothetical protein
MDDKLSRMKWKFLLIFFPVGTCSFSFIGKWRVMDVIIDAKETHVIGTINENKSIVEMEIKEYSTDKIVLDNLNIIKKPKDWFNVVKYKNHVDIFRKIKKEGLVCGLSFIDENNLMVEPQIGEEDCRFVLLRIKK